MNPVKIITETVVFDGAQKTFRILNLSTGTVYAGHFKSRYDAGAAIEHNKARAGSLVKRTSTEVLQTLHSKLFDDHTPARQLIAELKASPEYVPKEGE